MPYKKSSLNEHFSASGPKRILALDGGGLRGILTLGILESVERELRSGVVTQTMLATCLPPYGAASPGARVHRCVRVLVPRNSPMDSVNPHRWALPDRRLSGRLPR